MLQNIIFFYLLILISFILLKLNVTNLQFFFIYAELLWIIVYGWIFCLFLFYNQSVFLITGILVLVFTALEILLISCIFILQHNIKF